MPDVVRRVRLQIFSLCLFGFFGVFDAEIPASTRISNGEANPSAILILTPLISLPLDASALPPIWGHTAQLAHHTNITLQGLPNWQYMLWLFLEDKEL